MKTKLLFLLILFYSSNIQLLNAQVFIDTSYTVEQMVMDFFNSDSVTVSNISVQGGDISVAYFEAANTDLGVPAGIFLSTGDVFGAIGPNSASGTSTNLGAPGTVVLDSLLSTGLTTFDAVVLEMDIVSTVENLDFSYVFGSEEYPEFVGTAFNDAFAFVVSGPGYPNHENIAVIPGASIPVTINSVNHLNNSSFYQESMGSLANDFEYDGFTVPLPAPFMVIPNETYRIQIAIADVADHIYDSGVFLSVESLNGDSTVTPPAIVETSQLGSIVEFENLSRYATSYQWDFGDSTNSTERDPVHNYSSMGDFNVTLVTENFCCSDTTNTMVTIDELIPNPQALSFSDASYLLVGQTFDSARPVGIADMNNDGLDDIVRVRENGGTSLLEVNYQVPNGGAFLGYYYGELPFGFSTWSLAMADVDENGANDILVGLSSGITLLMSNNTGTSFSYENNLDIPTGIFTQGVNFVDIDNNGTLDIFACHDLNLSRPYSNDGMGNFTLDHDLINTASTIPSDNSGNYGSVWTDYDNDGDLDLYISKCRFGVSDSLDGRRVNLLFQNNDGVYTDVAEAANLRPLNQSWATTFGDIDNDGDLDCFIINHEDFDSQLYENNGDGTFTDITAGSGIVDDIQDVGYGFQAHFADFDNDGFVDLLYTGGSNVHRLFRNHHGDLTFTVAETPFPTDGTGIRDAAIGDLNHDGYLDVYANLTNNPDRLFLNNGGDNNYFSVLLEGAPGYRNGIGARVELYGSWGKQIREVRSGESFGVMNSFTCHFGIREATAIDSLVIKWPSGTIDRLCDPAINQHLNFSEGDAPRVEADFNYVITDLMVDFTSAISGEPDSVIWDFDDNTITMVLNPTHTYANYDNYTVTLTAYDECGPNITTQVVSLLDALPVDLLDFQAKEINKHHVQLTWETASERNFSNFVVERSTDGEHFEAILSVDGNGFTDERKTYLEDDLYPHQGINYYRLKLIDLDGSFDYSVIRVVSINSEIDEWQVYPNPTKNLVFFKQANREMPASANLYDINGIRLKHAQFNEQEEVFFNLASLETGIYFIKIQIGDQVVTRRIIRL